MAVREIVLYPNEVLEIECEKVTEFDSDLKRLIEDMFETMYEAEGVGIAAPQIGIAKQVAVVNIGTEEAEPLEMVNPVVLETVGEEAGPEGCLSFPGLFGEVIRPHSVKVEAQDRSGNSYTIEAEGFLARAIQHEIDHLHGILFTEKVTRYYNEEDLKHEE
ncbi:peptide deformylase [Pseudalkalibacillus caeni]|uniref:Peptide deformylase n=1 Tax=Exobacillus caeni TaxID=2574798 RepID=A0A5R9F4N6_9BACL|nr:peptide deformylase [Pseudalkalibacillus caeni]TLS37316.1 peptide deformylase [Pseudalkalibacillus caeni]